MTIFTSLFQFKEKEQELNQSIDKYKANFDDVSAKLKTAEEGWFNLVVYIGNYHC